MAGGIRDKGEWWPSPGERSEVEVIDDKWGLGIFCRRVAAGPEKEAEEEFVQTNLASFSAEVVSPIKTKAKQTNKKTSFQEKLTISVKQEVNIF